MRRIGEIRRTKEHQSQDGQCDQQSARQSRQQPERQSQRQDDLHGGKPAPAGNQAKLHVRHQKRRLNPVCGSVAWQTTGSGQYQHDCQPQAQDHWPQCQRALIQRRGEAFLVGVQPVFGTQGDHCHRGADSSGNAKPEMA